MKLLESKMKETMGPRESAELISKSLKHVSIHESGVKDLAKKLLEIIRADKESIHIKGWKTHALHPKVADESAINWIFLVDALNFSFWSVPGKKKYLVRYNDTDHTGYWSLCAAVNRALDEGIPITSAEYCRDFTMEKALKVFRSDSATAMPMIEERVKVMQEIGQVLLEKFNGKFSNLICQAKGSGQSLLRLVLDNFPCFRDENVYNNQKVSFYKRAQILVADLWACFEGQGHGEFDDIDSITMFADYRVPQALVYFGAMSYGKELDALLEKDHMFSSGDLMEMEIRAASIRVVDLVAKTMNEMIEGDEELNEVHINAILIDHFLWDYRKKQDAQTKEIPFHKIRCIYY